MKILVCYTRFPWPLIKGDLLTVHKLLEFLSERHHVDLLTVEPEDPTFVDFLPQRLASMTMVPNGSLARIARLPRSFVSGRSLQIDLFFGASFAARRSELIEKGDYDIVYSHYIRSCGHEDFGSAGARKVIGLQLSHQSHFSLAAKKDGNSLLRWLYAVEAKRLEDWEGRIAGYHDLIHLISPKDMTRIKGYENWQDRVLFNPHGVDTQEFTPDPASRIVGRVVFTGGLRFQANRDAVMWLVKEIWPRILSACPSAELIVAGSSPSAALRAAVNSAGNAKLIPNPERMAEVIQTGDVAVDPLRIGAGLQNKVLEAMSCGLPVVATTLANRGIGAIPGSEILLADDAESIANEVVNLILDRRYNERIGSAARSAIERSWTWEHHFEALDERWETLLGERLTVR